jgi:hypothetical protein
VRGLSKLDSHLRRSSQDAKEKTDDQDDLHQPTRAQFAQGEVLLDGPERYASAGMTEFGRRPSSKIGEQLKDW